MNKMNKRMIEINVDEEPIRAINEAQRIFYEGGIFIYPTDTIYGFGANPFNNEACNTVAEIKQRDDRKQFIMLVHNIDTLMKYVSITDEFHIDFLLTVWPNPVSVILNLNRETSKLLGFATGAFRIPYHNFCNKLLSAIKMPLISNSVNRSGEPPMNDFVTMKQEFLTEVDAILYSRKSQFQISSTVIDLTGHEMKLLREGRVAFKILQTKFQEMKKRFT